MTTKQRAYLKGLAMTMDPIFQIGKASMNPGLTQAVSEALDARELIKLSVLNNCMDDPRELAETLAQRTRSEVVQVIGKKIVLYREGKDDKKKIIHKELLMKVGIMGGTFDPIHIGHLLLGEFAYEDFGLDEIWFVPNGNPPHKETKDSEQALRNRVEMVRLAIEHIPYFKLDLSEADTTKHSYTYQTMKEFNRLYPDVDFYFILGADSLFSIEEWRFFREIFTTCTILAAMRDDKDISAMRGQILYLKQTYGANIELLRAPLVEVSSTTIRKRASDGLTVRFMVPDNVADYIREQKLYREEGR